MKETKFIQQNHKKWADFEALSKSRDKDSNLYSKLFIQITDDLSYSRTFYANRSVRVYLNNLAQHIFHKVFSRKKKKQHVFRDFWMEELPSVMYYHRMELLIAFVILLIAMSIGLLTYYHDPTFANKILGDGYVAMTAENIAKKDPMAVYKKMGPVEMFIKIALNNLRVDILTFFSGLIMGIGSVLVLLHNGLMLSAFQFYFIKRGLFWDSFLAVWLHGTLEISAMVICGAAGLVLGKGIVFPGTYSRIQSFFSSAQRATKIFFSVLPITVAAAVIESVLTRYTEAPDLLRLALIIISLLFILGYYVYLPWVKKQNGTLKLPEAERVLPENFRPFEFHTVKKVSEILLDTFRLFRKYSGLFSAVLFRSVVLITIIGLTLNKRYLLNDIIYTEWSVVNLNYFLDAHKLNWMAFLIPCWFTYVFNSAAYIFSTERLQQQQQPLLTQYEWMKSNWRALLVSLGIHTGFYLFFSFYEFSFYTYLFIMPMLFTAVYAVFFPYRDLNSNKSLASFSMTFKSGFLNLFAIHLVFMVLSIALFFLMSSSVFWLIYEAVTMNLTNELVDSDMVYLFFFLISVSFVITLSLVFFSLYQGVFYFSQRERHTAEGLKEDLDKLGKTPKRYAM
jgi:uncharacterized membrane protein SpoIIM required for sporulation